MILLKLIVAGLLVFTPAATAHSPTPADFNSAACTADTAQVASTQSALTAALAAVPLVQLTVDQLRQTLADQTRARDFACRDRDNHAGAPFGGQIYNSCQEYASHDIYSLRRGDPRYRPQFDPNGSGIACAPTTTTNTTVNGDCTTVTTTTTDYVNAINTWNGFADRYRGDPTLTQAQRDELRRAQLERDRLSAAYNQYRSPANTSTNTTCTPPPVTVNVAPAPPAYSAPSPVYRYPVGAPATGDGSTASDVVG